MFLLISVMSLSKGIKGQNEKSGQSFFVCVTCYKLVAGKPAFLHHLWSKQNCQALFVYHADLEQNLCHFLPYFTYNSAVSHRIISQLQIALIQFRAIEACASLALAQQLIKITISNVFIWRIQLLDRTVQSGQSTSV